LIWRSRIIDMRKSGTRWHFWRFKTADRIAFLEEMKALREKKDD